MAREFIRECIMQMSHSVSSFESEQWVKLEERLVFFLSMA